MEAGILDHLLALLLIVAMPVKGMREYDRMLEKLRVGEPGVRLKMYRQTLMQQWGLVAVLLAVWFLGSRTLISLGLDFDFGVKALIGWVLAIAIAVALLLQTRSVLRSSESMSAVRQELESLRDLIPHNTRESQLFAALSVTAGICEELLYRGFLLAYFESLLGIWLAMVLSSVAFGLGHAYQGVRGIFKTAGIGLAMAILFVLTGGLWAPMLVHAFVDLNSGYLGRRALEGWEPTVEAA